MVVCFLIFILSVFGVFNFLGRALHIVGVPIWKSSNKVSGIVIGPNSIFLTKTSLIKDNQDLRAKNMELTNTMLDYSVLKKENEDLKELLGRLPTKSEYTLGVVLTKPSRSLYDTLVIDIGLADGIFEADEVFASGNIPIGYVSESFAHTSVVRLYSSPGEKLEAEVEGTNATTILTGRGGGNFEMSVPRDLNIISGATLIIPRINANVVAIVANVISDAHEPLQKVILRSPVNIEELKWVQVKK